MRRDGTMAMNMGLLIVANMLLNMAMATQIYPSKSGLSMWVDPETPSNRQTYTSSRGGKWSLVMSDEFNKPKRSFKPGHDHLWTSLEKPDGVNGALEVLSHNMTSTECDNNGTCYFYIKTVDEDQNVTVFNAYARPPSSQVVRFFYRAGMVQSWNKFCFQGGMLEVRAQLPGAIDPKSGNPDLKLGASGRTNELAYYPTWPGIWMMGNLGRAVFTASTNRMWPFSYDRCEPEIFDPKNQRISACNATPGYGMLPNRGRGAPEIDLLEGGGVAISSSLQIGPGMPMNFRLQPPDNKTENAGQEYNPYWSYCIYSGECKTLGANYPGVPASFFAKRGHPSWYQGLRYGANPFCKSDPKYVQNYQTVAASMKAGIVENKCNMQNCPGSKDGYADLGLIDGVGPAHWGINYNGTCFPVMNAYMGSYLCDPDNTNKLCVEPRNSSTPPTKMMPSFNYQMDAISSNWPVQVGAYTDFLVYQIEWVTGKNGYVRWMLEGHPIFEITSEAFSNVPEDDKMTNPRKVMLEEPMYIIFNIALSKSWGARPAFTDKPCRGDGKDPKVNKICDSYPMYMKIDYIRLYQDFDPKRDSDNLMQIGCDPPTHPTRQWILGHIDEYVDLDNPATEVQGGAGCTVDDDCTVEISGSIRLTRLVTGKCSNKRCVCTHPESWGGPRCSTALSEIASSKGGKTTFGPPMEFAFLVAAVTFIVTFLTFWRQRKKSQAAIAQAVKRGNDKPPPSAMGLSPNESEMLSKPAYNNHSFV